ncbi:MAG: hypothetical protein ACPKPY_14040 [Nitrososphaeraceae archaeon]
MLTISNLEPPEPDNIRLLDLSDIAMMSGLADLLRKELQKYLGIDPCTSPDPFTDKYDENNYSYNIIVEREKVARIIAMIILSKNITKKENIFLNIWNKIPKENLEIIQLSKEKAIKLKYEMMPKDTNNFYPVRHDGKIIGYIMFAFQICGQY